jgi:hypothetical protein
VEQAAGIIRKVRGPHLIYIFQWLNFGRGKLFTYNSEHKLSPRQDRRGRLMGCLQIAGLK